MLTKTLREGNAFQFQPIHELDICLGNGFELRNIYFFGIHRQGIAYYGDSESIVASQDIVDGFLELPSGADNGFTSGRIEFDVTYSGEERTNDSG